MLVVPTGHTHICFYLKVHLCCLGEYIKGASSNNNNNNNAVIKGVK